MPDLAASVRSFTARALCVDIWVDVVVVGRPRCFVAMATIAGDVDMGFGASPAAAIDEVLTREFGPLGWEIDERPRAHPHRL